MLVAVIAIVLSVILIGHIILVVRREVVLSAQQRQLQQRIKEYSTRKDKNPC